MSDVKPDAVEPEVAAELLDALALSGTKDVDGDGDGSGSEGEAAASAGGAGGPAAASKSKRRRNKKKKAAAGAGAAGLDGVKHDVDVTEAPVDAAAIEALGPSERLKQLNKSLQTVAAAPHAFWDSQPVPKLDEDIEASTHCPIEEDKPLEELRQEPLPLPEGFVWCDVDLAETAQLTEVYELLAENYVEDDDCLFRFNYSPEFLVWTLIVPGYYKDWHVGVRAAKSGKLVGFISGTPAHISMWGRVKKMCEINFLCVHKKLRSKRLAPVLIKEVTRRVNCRGMFQAVYTAGVAIPKPVSACQYYHRSLNPRKLIDIGFSRLPPKMTMNLTERLYRVDAAPKIPGIRAMLPKDVKQACALLNTYLTKFGLHQVFSESDFAHQLLPRPNVVNSYVVEDDKGVITDMCSFYHLPSTVISNPKHKMLNAVYAYYTVPAKHTLEQLFGDMLILAKTENQDVFNCLDMMDNATMFKEMKFGPGDGLLHYYLYNWKCPQMDNSKVGLILV